MPDGQDLVLERLACAPLQAPGGSVAVCDPVSLEWQGPPVEIDLRGLRAAGARSQRCDGPPPAARCSSRRWRSSATSRR